MFTNVHVEKGRNGELFVIPYGYLTELELTEAQKNVYKITLINKANDEIMCVFDNLNSVTNNEYVNLLKTGSTYKVILDTIIDNCYSQIYCQNDKSFALLIEKII